jgi:hypothetical protein
MTEVPRSYSKADMKLLAYRRQWGSNRNLRPSEPSSSPQFPNPLKSLRFYPPSLPVIPTFSLSLSHGNLPEPTNSANSLTPRTNEQLCFHKMRVCPRFAQHLFGRLRRQPRLANSLKRMCSLCTLQPGSSKKRIPPPPGSSNGPISNRICAVGSLLVEGMCFPILTTKSVVRMGHPLPGRYA